MTYQRIDDTGAETGRRIEITGAMLSAAARALSLFDPQFATANEGAARVLSAALEAGGSTVTGTVEP